MTEPTLRRKFVYTDLRGNSNKEWQVEFYPPSRLITRWGRVGNQLQENEKTASYTQVERLIAEKLNKGYQEVELHTINGKPPSPALLPSGDPKVDQLVTFIYQENGQQVKSFLAVTVDALSMNQIRRGRILLKVIDRLANDYHNRLKDAKRIWPELEENVEEYLRTIPTQLPSKIDPRSVTQNFIQDLHEQEDRLDQLEAALATFGANTPTQQINALGGTVIEHLDPKHPARVKLADYVLRTCGGYRKLHDIYKVQIPAERAAFDAEKRGKHNVTALFHGTHTQNLLHILKQGLIVPQVASNGRRFGAGIYFADMSRRSLNYCGSRRGSLVTLLVCDVALGKPKKLTGDDSSLRAAPPGYDSVWGVNSYSGMDEFVVFRAAQQTIRALIAVE